MKKKALSKEEAILSLQQLKSELAHILEELGQTKKETIVVKRSGKRTLFYSNCDGVLKYVAPTDTSEIKRLAASRYNNDIIETGEREIAQLDKAIKALSDSKHGIADIDKIYEQFPDILKPFITPHPLSSEAYARAWQESNAVVKRRRVHAKDDYHIYKTIRGDYVGSKSEEMIANRLLVNGIPYHYEVAFIPEAKVEHDRPVYDMEGTVVGYESSWFDPLAEDTLHPDFYVLNKRTRKAYFWEHLGKLDDPKYCKINLNRLVRMLDAGYSVGEDILITHEDSAHPLRTESIDDIIEKYLK